MFLHNFIKIYDNVVPVDIISSLIKWGSQQNFNQGTLAANQLNKEIRDAQVFGLTSEEAESKTYRHWANFLSYIIKNNLDRYQAEVAGFTGVFLNRINEISFLKYENAGHYDLHTDDYMGVHRILSCVLILNNDYEGGQLQFSYPNKKDIYLKVDPQPGRLIIWPSNFLYPHGVLPVTKGIRYAIVSWAC